MSALDLEALEIAARVAEDDSPSPYIHDRKESELRDANGDWLASFDHNTQGEFYAAWNPATALSVLARLRAAEIENEKLQGSLIDENARATTAEALADRLRQAAERVELQSSNAVFNLSQNNARGMDNAEALRTFKHFSEVLSSALEGQLS